MYVSIHEAAKVIGGEIIATQANGQLDYRIVRSRPAKKGSVRR